MTEGARALFRALVQRHSSVRAKKLLSTDPRVDQEMVVVKLNRTLIGWANYFCLGPVSKAYRAVEKHAGKRLRQWLCAKHKLVWRGTKRFPKDSLPKVVGLVCLTQRTSNLPWATS